MSPAHRAAVRFLRGGLVAMVSLLVPSQLGSWSRAFPALGPLVALARLVVPALGFAAAGAIGATALGRGRRGGRAFAAGMSATGLALSFTAPLLQNLTGFEPPAIVALFAAVTTAGAFALGGSIAALALEPRHAVALAAGFAFGGAFGGLLTVTPSLLAGGLAAWPPEAQLFVNLASSLLGLLAPFAIGGAVAGRRLEDGAGR